MCGVAEAAAAQTRAVAGQCWCVLGWFGALGCCDGVQHNGSHTAWTKEVGQGGVQCYAECWWQQCRVCGNLKQLRLEQQQLQGQRWCVLLGRLAPWMVMAHSTLACTSRGSRCGSGRCCSGARGVFRSCAAWTPAAAVLVQTVCAAAAAALHMGNFKPLGG
jgi:hypothetical protein